MICGYQRVAGMKEIHRTLYPSMSFPFDGFRSKTIIFLYVSRLNPEKFVTGIRTGVRLEFARFLQGLIGSVMSLETLFHTTPISALLLYNFNLSESTTTSNCLPVYAFQIIVPNCAVVLNLVRDATRLFPSFN